MFGLSFCYYFLFYYDFAEPFVTDRRGYISLHCCDETVLSYGSFRLCLRQNPNKVVMVFFGERRVRWEDGHTQKTSSLAPKNDLNELKPRRAQNNNSVPSLQPMEYFGRNGLS
ncbi:unnamed protein product, partial [Vitis vinifera]